MTRSRIAAVLAVGTLVLGGGIALAETGPDDPVTDDNEVVGEVEELDVETTDPTDTTEADGTEVVEDDVEVEVEEHSAQGEHGAVVSEAAHNHDHDEACGNHGHWVSGWARTGEEPECATTTAEVEADGVEADATGDDSTADDVEAEDETDETDEADDETDEGDASTEDAVTDTGTEADSGPGQGHGKGHSKKG
jgi:hypothetical protein